MNWRSRIPAVPGVVIAVSAMLLGVLTGAWITFVSPRSLGFVLGRSLGISLAVILAGALVALVVLRAVADRECSKEREFLNAFLEYIPDNVYFKDRKSRFVRINRAMAKYFGLSDPAQAVHKTDADIFSREHAGRALADEQNIIEAAEALTDKEEKETWPDGHETWVLTTKVPLRDRRGRILGMMGISRDITDRKQVEQRARHMALHDALTGLPNRVLLEDLLNKAISLANRNQKRVAVLMMDMDRFKGVNDSFGREVGDRLLEGVAARLRSSLRESDIVARLGGDEFVVCLPMVDPGRSIEIVADKVLSALSAPFCIAGNEIQVGVSVGMCEFPAHGDNAKELLQAADMAMYEAKRNGRGTHCLFTSELTDATRRRQKFESDLRHALERNQFVLHYQPLVSTSSGRITGMETLLRWRHPEQGMVFPNHFIPQLEELGLMVDVGNWVLKTACLQNAAWQRQGLAPVRVMVNLSSTQFYRGDIVNSVKTALAESGLDPKWLELELTESLMLDDSELTIKIMRALKGLGVSLSLDDFGTGWSSLAYLRRFPIDRIKIDRSFLLDIASEPTAEAVVRGIINLGRDLGLACVAEGVETAEQLEYFRQQHCEEVQGYLYSPAVPEAECRELLRAGRMSSGQKSSVANRNTGKDPRYATPAA